MDAAVGRIAAAGDQPGGFQGVQVVGQRRLPDADCLGKLALAASLMRFHGEQHKPGRQ